MAKKYTVLETWIVKETNPIESTSAEQLFDRLERLGEGRLPVIDVVPDYRQDGHFLDEARIRDFAAHMGPAQDILDIGPGDGWPMLRLAPLFKSVTGVEPSPKRAAVIQANAERLGLKNVVVKQMSATKLDFPDRSFDGAVAACSIEQTPDPQQALSEIFRVMKPGGKFRIEFESYEGKERGFEEDVLLTETADSLGYHYVIKHSRPAWERSYLIKFALTPELKEAFAKLKDLMERIGRSPSTNPEVGLQFLERHQGSIVGASFYELEHFTAATMKQALEEAGFVNVRVAYSAATLAKTVWPRIRESGMSDGQIQALCQGLADVAVKLDASSSLNEPLVATRPS
ncbi:MAG: methyltransferase domain-containing protein [candidate division WOR-3 bacterium]